MRILLTQAPFYDKTDNKWCGVRAGCRWPFIFDYPLPPENTVGGYNTMPFFMAYATNYLASTAKVGEVYMYDAVAVKHRFDTYYNNVAKANPEITILETSTPSIKIDLEAAERIKGMGSEIALCGPHATAYAEELIKLPYVDYVLKGEYEVNSYEMCLMRRKGIYECRIMPTIEYMTPYRDAAVYNYADGFGQDAHIQYPQLQVWSSRGCPFRCNFCLWNETMTCGKYRKRSPEAVRDEIMSCIKVFGFKSVLFDEDTFNVGDARVYEMSKMMGGIGIQWHAMVRADACSKEAFWNMKQAGCVGIKAGIETFSQRGLDYLNKGYKAQELKDRVNFLIQCGFKVFLSFMENIPGETEEDKADTIRTAEHFIKQGASIQHPSCMPLPGTKLYKELDKEGKIDKSDWTKFGCFHGEVLKA